MQLHKLLKIPQPDPVVESITKLLFGFLFLLFSILWLIFDGYFEKDVYMFLIAILLTILLGIFLKGKYNIPTHKKGGVNLRLHFFCCVLAILIITVFLFLSNWVDPTNSNEFLVLWISLLTTGVLAIFSDTKLYFPLSLILICGLTFFFFVFPNLLDWIKLFFLAFGFLVFFLGVLNFRKN